MIAVVLLDFFCFAVSKWKEDISNDWNYTNLEIEIHFYASQNSNETF